MSDTQLLELAAKACGMPRPVDDNGLWSAWVGSLESGHWWNPLDDDGDALRISSKLSLDIVFDCYPQRAMDETRKAFRVRVWAVGWVKEEFDDEASKIAAIRRVVVRAAASIGERMP